MHTFNRRLRIEKVVRATAVAGLLGLALRSAHAYSSFYNVDLLQDTGLDQTTLTVVLAGNQVDALGSAFYDPFVMFGSHMVNGFGNTTVTFADGKTTITYNSHFAPITDGTASHYGFQYIPDISASSTPTVLNTYWGAPTTIINVKPSLSIEDPVAEPTSGNILYLIEAIKVAFNAAGAGASTIWEEFTVPADTVDPVDIMNNSATPYIISDAKFFFSVTEIPLDGLSSYFDDPETDPRFEDISGIDDGTELMPGASLDVEIETPEPATVALLVPAVCGLLRRRSSREKR